MRSVYDAVKVATAVQPNVKTGTGTPSANKIIAVDTFGYNSAMFNVSVGTPSGTAVTYVVTLTVSECATSTGTYASVSGLTGTVTGTTTSGVFECQVRVEGLGTSRLRYLKLTPLVTMTPNDGQTIPISAVALLGRAFKEPVGNDSDV
jgi:hypothetical protein